MAYNWVLNPLTGRLDITDVNMSPPGDVEFLEGDSGGSVGPDAGHTIFIVGGSGVSVAGVPGTNTLTINATGGGFTWNTVAGVSEDLVAHNAYIPQNGALTTFTLPATAAVGDTYIVSGYGAGGWKIAQRAGQVINVGSVLSTTGVGGSVSSTNQYDVIEITCVVANTEFSGLAKTGVLNII